MFAPSLKFATGRLSDTLNVEPGLADSRDSESINRFCIWWIELPVLLFAATSRWSLFGNTILQEGKELSGGGVGSDLALASVAHERWCEPVRMFVRLLAVISGVDGELIKPCEDIGALNKLIEGSLILKEGFPKLVECFPIIGRTGIETDAARFNSGNEYRSIPQPSPPAVTKDAFIDGSFSAGNMSRNDGLTGRIPPVSTPGYHSVDVYGLPDLPSGTALNVIIYMSSRHIPP